MNDWALVSPDIPSVVGISTRPAILRRVSIAARIARSRRITVAVYVVSISAHARSVRIGYVAVIRHVSIGVVAVLRLIGVALIGIGRLVAIPVSIAIASGPRSTSITAVIGCRADTDAHAKTRGADPQALRVGRSHCCGQRDGCRNSNSKCSHSNLLV